MAFTARQEEQQQSEGGRIDGEDSNDECFLCGKLWDPSCKGWPLCDACPNTCCTECASVLIVGDGDFYCPSCTSNGQSAAAAVGGAIASAVRVCSQIIDELPVSAKAIQTILRNLQKDPNNPKYRKLRLRNKKVQELLDLDPCRRVLTMVGFTETMQPSATSQSDDEPMLVLLDDHRVDAGELQQLLDIFEGLQEPAVPEKDTAEKKHGRTDETANNTSDTDDDESNHQASKVQKTTDKR
eukprot:scaffold265_cov131-Cylindrotheca_fusiformis.AAC.17